MIQLGVVMTQGVGFHEWERTGLLDREISLYHNLQDVQTTFFHDEDEQVDYREFRFVPKGKLVQTHLDVIKSNQIDGADVGLEAARKKDIPFVLRCGYSWADFQQHRAISRFQKWKARRYEKKLAQRADLCVVSNQSDRDLFVKTYKVDHNKVCVHPNWVDTDLWKANKKETKIPVIISVGRLVTQKNQRLLIEAVSHLKNVQLKIIGQGPLKDELLQLAADLKVNLVIDGPYTQSQLVDELNQASVFVLCSHYEGLPKALLEAMAVELTCVSAPVQGIDDLIEDQKNGFIAERTVESLSEIIKSILNSDTHQIGKKARQTILEKYSLKRARLLEQEMIEKCLQR